MHSLLIERCKTNDRQAQLQVYRDYVQGMYCVAMRFVGNADDAEDVVQEAFIKAFRKLDQFRGEVTFGAWLKRIVVNGSIDFLKKKKNEPVPWNDSYMEIVDDSDWEVHEGIGILEVERAIEQLPEKNRIIVKLFLVEGYDHAEISEILKISGTASRTRLMRGKAQLKELLTQQGYGTGS